MERRNTVQRELVLDAVRQLMNHASADEVYRYISERHPSVGKATVYRNLNLLADEGQILRVRLPGGAEHFDHNCHDHYHVYCISCGQVQDVDMESLGDLKQYILDDHGIEYLGYDVVFRGICAECRESSLPRH